MGSWSEVLLEFKESQEQRAALGLGPDSDAIRLRHIRRLHEITGRAVIVYSSAWLSPRQSSDPSAFSVTGADIHALMEVCHNVKGRELDLVLHSPGGSPEAAEQMLNYLRTQFDDIRAFVPLQAKSAATMIALGCDEIWMGLHSELGPIDPQLLVPVPEGRRWAPAHAILRDFERAKKEIGANTEYLAAWTPILRSYTGGLLEFCSQQIKLSRDIVAGWLEKYMLARGEPSIEVDARKAVAESIADHFSSEASYDRFRTHGRPIRVEELEGLPGMRVRRLESEPTLQDAVLSVYHALDLTANFSPVAKMVENHIGARHVRMAAETVVAQGTPPITVPAPPAAPKPAIASPPAPRPRQARGGKRKK